VRRENNALHALHIHVPAQLLARDGM